RFPEGRVDDRGIAGNDHHVGGAGVRILVEDPLERFAAVGRAEDSTLFVGAVGMTEDRDEEAARILRVHGDLRDLLPVAQAEVLPGPARVDGLVDSVSGREIGPLQALRSEEHTSELQSRGQFVWRLLIVYNILY